MDRVASMDSDREERPRGRRDRDEDDKGDDKRNDKRDDKREDRRDDKRDDKRKDDDRGGGDRGGGDRGGGGGGRDQNGRNPDAKLYVGNVPNEMREDDLREIFEKFGDLSDVFMPKDPETGGKRGFAFVTFVDVRDAQDAAAKLDGKNVGGRELRVNKPREGPGGGGGGGGGRRYEPRPDSGRPSASTSAPTSHPFLEGRRPNGERKYDRVTGDLIK